MGMRKEGWCSYSFSSSTQHHHTSAVQRGRIPPSIHPYASALMFSSGGSAGAGSDATTALSQAAYLSSFISHLIRAEPYPLARFATAGMYLFWKICKFANEYYKFAYLMVQI
jgi:hypothetical protein